MIICPQCGQTAGDEVKFCERCGQGLASAPSAPPPLRPLASGTRLKRGHEIVELIGQAFNENRYRVRLERDGKTEFLQLRERAAPSDAAGVAPPEVSPPPATEPAEDPNGPRAKTAELRVHARPADAAPAAAPAATTEATSETVDARAAEEAAEASSDGAVIELVEQQMEPASDGATLPAPAGEPAAPEAPDDLGEVFGRVLSLSMTLDHPAFLRAIDGFAEGGRVYLIYPDLKPTPLSAALPMNEAGALGVALQVCQAVSYLNKRGLRLNDIFPGSIAYGDNGRIIVTGLDFISNDIEVQSDPIFNDGYSAPEIYRGRGVDKRADVFSIGCLLYTCLTGERIECESWRGEAGTVRFYPPHVVAPEIEQIVRKAIAFKPADRWANVDALKAELLRLNARIRLRSGGLTDVGMVREHNEDSVMMIEFRRDSMVEPAQGFLYVVSDGMGGAEAGEVASAIAVGTIRDYVEQRILPGNGHAPAADKTMPVFAPAILQEALEEANRKIIEYQAARPESRGMGATGVGLMIVPPDAVIAWVGDSRAYMYEDGKLRQVTKDHSLVQRLVEIGQITAEEARHHEHKNVITRSLGARQTGPAGAEALSLRLRRGSRLMLCSDGLTAHVQDAEIARVMGQHADPLAAARELVVAANAGGGTDNISVIVVFVE